MTIDTALELNARYSYCDGFLLSNPTLYHTVVGSLVHLTIIRPESQFVTSPIAVNWATVFRILRYLWGT